MKINPLRNRVLFLVPALVFLLSSLSALGETSSKELGANSPKESRFVYEKNCTSDNQGKKICFEDGAAFQEVNVGDYGSIKVQSIAKQWPDGEVFVDADGTRSYSINKYEGYLQNRVADSIDFVTLDTPAKVARSAATAVVQVYADRCLLNQNGSKKWVFSTLPRTGFFIGPDLIITDLRATKNLATDPSGGGSWNGGVIPSPNPPRNPMSCEQYLNEFFQGASAISFEVGAGPFIQTFDGTWGSGSIVASDQNFALIKLSKGTKDKNSLALDWQNWASLKAQTSILQIAKAGVTRSNPLVSIHNPIEGREAGGWHVTTSKLIKNCEDTFYLDGYSNGASDAFAADFWSDSGSVGAPILDNDGYVVGMIKSDYPDVPDTCYGTVHTSKNSLGVLSTFFADPKKSTVAIGARDLRNFIASYDEKLTAVTNSTKVNIADNKIWPVSGVSLATTNYEVIDYGESFTVSGFPKSEFSSQAFEIAKQSTVMYIRANGCSTCKLGDLTADFSDSCLCTGFAVSKNLIVVNDHCVTELALGDETTFKTYKGQIVNARLVNRSGLDTSDIYTKLLKNQNSVGVNRGDVALMRTDQEMDLTPVEFADSSKLSRRDPLITVGHPAIMLRSGPYVASGGAFIGLEGDDRSTLHYTLPANSGASGSGVFDLKGRLVGQIANGTSGYRSAELTWLKSELNKNALEISPSAVFFDLQPRPFLIGPRVQIGLGNASSGASSNYILDLINYWAPGELKGSRGLVKSDSDGDGVTDSADAFPDDSSETKDRDADGVGDNADTFPNDPLETADSDGDGVGDNADFYPNDASESEYTICKDTSASVTLAHASTLPVEARLVVANPASNKNQQTFVRFVNPSSEAVQVELYGTDDKGAASKSPPISLTLAAGESKQMTAQDLENGNAAKGLASSMCDGTGKWQITARSSKAIQIMGLIRTPDGFLTGLTDVVPVESGSNIVYFANPASTTKQQTFLRIVNNDSTKGNVTITAIDNPGVAANESVSFELAANGSKQMTAQDLENGNAAKGLTGKLGDGTGKWRLTIASSLDLSAQSLIRTPDGFLTNLSALVTPNENGTSTLRFFNPASNIAQQSFVRVVNSSSESSAVTISGVDDSGQIAPNGNVLLTLAAGQSTELSAADLEQGNTELKLTGSLGVGSGRWRLDVSSDPQISVMSYVLTSTGFLTNMSEVVGAASTINTVWIFNPGSNSNQASKLRVINSGSSTAAVSISGIDDSGKASPGTNLTFNLSGGSAKEMTAAELENGSSEKGLAGGIGNGKGKWRLTVTSDAPVTVQSLLETPAGFITNLSTSAR